MANNAFIKLPEFWEFSPTAWFAQTEAQFAIRDVTDDTTRYYHVVSALGRSTATREVNFIAIHRILLFGASGTANPLNIWR